MIESRRLSFHVLCNHVFYCSTAIIALIDLILNFFNADKLFLNPLSDEQLQVMALSIVTN